MANSAEIVVDWTVPAGRTDWLMGTGATRAERACVWLATGTALAALPATALLQDVAWSWWQWLVVVVLTVDVAGGVPANALSTAKRLYHSLPPPDAPARQRLLLHPVAFSALHLHPFLVALLLPGEGAAWAAACYVVALTGTIAVVSCPLYLRRPLAAAWVTVALVAAPLVDAPDGLLWLGPALVLKLVATHAVREEPYRPGPA